MSTSEDPSHHWNASEYVANYKDCFNLFQNYIFPVLSQVINFTPKSKFLEVGCGSGKWSACFAIMGMYGVLVDNNPAMLERVRENFPAISKSFFLIEDDARTLEKVTNNSFDLIFSEGLLEHFNKEERERVIINMASKMKHTDSCLLLIVPHDYKDTHGGEHRWENLEEFSREIGETKQFNYVIPIKFVEDGSEEVPWLGVLAYKGEINPLERISSK